MSTRSPNASPDRANTTPSTTVDTEGSPAIEKVVVPTPRRNSDWLSVVPDFWKLSAGTSVTAPSRPGRLSAASAWPLTTETAIGTSCNRSLRFCAVTTISPFCAGGRSAGGERVAGCSAATPGAGGAAGPACGAGLDAGADGAASCALAEAAVSAGSAAPISIRTRVVVFIVILP